ncbi:MAG TPA: BamA/TamA family outer membrane protein, partial [Acidobacteriota bacterium]|nr:BamA/TamA family outer membrane protein [Acidobacteriota bacterium]
SIQMAKNAREKLALADIVLKPDLTEFKYGDYDRIGEIIEAGKEETGRRLEELRQLTANASPRPLHEALPAEIHFIESISFLGLKQIPKSQMKNNLRVRPGDTVNTVAIAADVSRLYATRLFESVRYNLEPLDDNRYHLSFVMREATLNTLGGAIRYDNDYTFVVLAELTARQIFNTPSKATVSTQFGGWERHSAAVRFIPSSAPFLFLEPKFEASRLERLDMRDRRLFDRFIDKREGGGIKIGGVISRHLEIAGHYRYERASVSGGSEPNRMAGSTTIGGVGLEFRWDSLDDTGHPRSGSQIALRYDKKGRTFGGALDYSRYQADYRHYISVSGKSTFTLNAGAGYSNGSVPFYDLYFVGGYSSAEITSRQFVGLRRDELIMRHMAIVGAEYSRQLFSQPLRLIRGGYLTCIYNFGIFSNSARAPYEAMNLNGAGLGLTIDTILGPLRATVGWAEGGRFNFYFSFGPAF